MYQEKFTHLSWKTQLFYACMCVMWVLVRSPVFIKLQFSAQAVEQARDGSIDTSMKGSSSLTKLEYQDSSSHFIFIVSFLCCSSQHTHYVTHIPKEPPKNPQIQTTLILSPSTSLEKLSASAPVKPREINRLDIPERFFGMLK